MVHFSGAETVIDIWLLHGLRIASNLADCMLVHSFEYYF